MKNLDHNGGEIKVESKAGEGTTFTVRLKTAEKA
jgi:signal transduction histidine kinase